MLKAFALAAALLPAWSAAQDAAAEAAIPPALKAWRGWASKDLDYRACPFLAASAAQAASDFICAWPGRLSLASSDDGATFTIHWRVDAASWIALPGGAAHWPQQVSVNGQRQPVLLHGGGPALWLPAGSYAVSGRIPWNERPQSLTVAQGIGLITLSVDGRSVTPIQRDADQLTLGRAAAAAAQADSIDLRVYRRLADGIPALLDTRIVIAVSGQAREEVLGPALPAGFAPTELSSAWPARLDGDGRLHVQVQPGSQTLALQARATAPLTAATARVPAAPWPQQEIWSYAAAPRLRVTVASAAVQVDPREAQVPADWQTLPAFALGDGARLSIEQRSRGLAADEANRLALWREAWLDFSGGGWYARDRVSGNMATGWRFDVATPYVLEQASAQNGNRGPEPLLVTRGTRPGSSGVEWRTSRVDLGAGVRIAAAATMPVAGWQQTFDSVQATLHFPFGYKLLGAPGADGVSGSWASAWSLLDVFVCAIAALLAWRLFGAAGALVALAFLLLGYQEAGSPLWTLIAAIGLTLTARALPAGRLARVARGLRITAIVLLILVALPFAAAQLRYALYPQLENGSYGGGDMPVAVRFERKDAALGGANAPAAMNDEMRQAEAPAAPPPPAMPAESEQAALATPLPQPAARHRLEAKAGDKSNSLQSIRVSGTRIERSQQIEHYSQTTVVQTGGGAPAWNLGSTARLSWSGPVLSTQSVHLVIAPPWLVRLLRVVLAALLAWLVWRVLRVDDGGPATRAAAAPGTAALLVGALALTAPVHAQDFPSPELLQQLRQRLSEAPQCAPGCASIAEAQVTANGDVIALALEAHAGGRVALPLPRDDATASLQGVRVDGRAEDAIARSADGSLWVALGRGVHRIELSFTASADKVSLVFPLPPRRVLFHGSGWDAAGLADDRLLTETLTLARARAAKAPAAGPGTQQFAPYVRIERRLSLGLEWTATTEVLRLAPASGGIAVDVPLLAGEHVATAGIKVRDGKAQVAIGDDAVNTNWRSTLDKADTLTLSAPPLGERAEVWTVLVSPTWHVAFAGVPEVGASAGDNPDDYRIFEFYPLPGETLTVTVTRPQAAQGATRAIDAVSLVTSVGQRAAEHVLAFTLRATQGGEQALHLPAGAAVTAASRDGVALNLRALDGKVSVPVIPGTHRYELHLRSGDAIGLATRTPPIGLGLPAANVALSLQLPADRWLLATWGPPVGPAVLYWGELIVMIGVAFALARSRRTRLRFRDWLLLGLGFSTFSWIALLVVVAWLFAFEWRRRGRLPALRWQFNLVQVALALLTLTAVACLVVAIPHGLLGQPDMHVAGNGSYPQSLRWFADRAADELPQASAISLPLWVYKVLMLAWALWLANALIGWLRDGFAAWTRDGYWRARSAAAAPADAAPAPNA